MPSELVALSNMPVVEEITNGDLKTVSYQESPIMSTYLVAVVVGLFDYVEDHTPDGKIMFSLYILGFGSLLVLTFPHIIEFGISTGVKVRVYCQVGKANQGKFALDVAVKTLELYKKYGTITNNPGLHFFLISI